MEKWTESRKRDNKGRKIENGPQPEMVEKMGFFCPCLFFCCQVFAPLSAFHSIYQVDWLASTLVFFFGESREELKGTIYMGQMGFCEHLRFPAVFCGNLQKSAVSCDFLRKSALSCGFLRNSALPKCCSSQEKRKSAKISEKTANLAPFVPFSLSLLIPQLRKCKVQQQVTPFPP